MLGKRGQFFLVAALVISGILIGLAGIYTQVNAPKEDSSVYDLSTELNFESLQVIDQGVYSDLPDEELYKNVANLTDYYASKNPSKQFIILYGNAQSIKLRLYTPKDLGTISVGAGGANVGTTVQTQTLETFNYSDLEVSSGEDVIGQAVCITARDGKEYCTNSSLGVSFATVITFSNKNTTYVARGGSSKTELVPDNNRVDCGGTRPDKVDGIIYGASRYSRTLGGTLLSWSYFTFYPGYNTTEFYLPACKWTCDISNSYVVDAVSNTCVKIGGDIVG